MDSEYLPESFLNHLLHERSLSQNTATTYNHHLRAYLSFLSEAGRPAKEATRRDILAYLGSMKERGLRPETIFCAAMALRAFYRFLAGGSQVSNDPTVDMALPKLTAHIVEPLSVEEASSLMDSPSERSWTGLRDHAILELLYCGLRISEALGLNTADIHLKEGYIKVLGKGSKERLVPIGGKAQESLRSYLTARSVRFGRVEGALFLSRGGKGLCKSGFWRRFKRHAARAGIKRRIYPHLLRHSFAVHMLAGRADLRSIQLLLGHNSLVTTQRYLRIDLNSLRETCLRAHPRFKERC